MKDKITITLTGEISQIFQSLKKTLRLPSKYIIKRLIEVLKEYEILTDGLALNVILKEMSAFGKREPNRPNRLRNPPPLPPVSKRKITNGMTNEQNDVINELKLFFKNKTQLKSMKEQRLSEAK